MKRPVKLSAAMRLAVENNILRLMLAGWCRSYGAHAPGDRLVGEIAAILRSAPAVTPDAPAARQRREAAGQFLLDMDARGDVDPEHMLEELWLFALYQEWSREHGLEALGDIWFRNFTLKRIGVTLALDRSGRRCYRSLTVNPPRWLSELVPYNPR